MTVVFIIADSVQTEYCPTFHCSCVRPFVTGVTSHISHIYKGINAMLIIRGPIKSYIHIALSSPYNPPIPKQEVH